MMPIDASHVDIFNYIHIEQYYVVFNKREECFIRVQKVEGAARDLFYSDKTRASSLLNIFKNNTYNTIG